LKIKRLDESLFSLAQSLEIVKNTRVETFFDDMAKKISEIEDSDFLRDVGENNPAGLVKELEKRVSASKEAMDKAVAALDKSGEQTINAQSIKRAEDDLANLLVLLEDARNAPAVSVGVDVERPNIPPVAVGVNVERPNIPPVALKFSAEDLEERISATKKRLDELKAKPFDSTATEIDRDAANQALETWKRYTGQLVEARRKALEDLNEESVSPAPEAPTVKRKEPKRKGYQIPQSERDRNRDGKDSRFRDEEDNRDPYAMDIAPSMTESNVGMTRRLRGEGGLSGRRGRRITSFSTPAHLADAINSRGAGLGEVDANRDPLLLAMKEAQKTRQHGNDLLERIEKKTGAAP